MLIDEFYNEWRSTPRWWFKATPEDDVYITNKYAPLLSETPDKNTLSHAHHDHLVPLAHIGPLVSLVIVFDQLPCHVYRGHENAATIIQSYRKIAVNIADVVLDELGLKNLRSLDDIDDIDFVFLLLPFRHTGNLETCMCVARMAWDRYDAMDNEAKAGAKLLKSFIKATYERAPRDQEGWVDYCPPCIPPGGTHPWDYAAFEDVLEYGPSQLRWKDVSLKEIAVVKDALKYHPWPDSIIISLSGGVDSMVIATVLRRLLPNHDIRAVHINYCNRANSAHEEAFVRHWAAVLGMPYYVRNITELQRDQGQSFMRSTYERYTRDVRFSTYSYVARQGSAIAQGAGAIAHTVLGHHEDDAFENVLTNIAHCEKFECLRGMEAIMQTQGPGGALALHRPLLRVSKTDIYRAAWTLGIPYLQDSTVKTCQRGTIRDVVRPTLEGWDPCIVRRMLEMADIVSEFASSFEKDVSDAVAKTKTGADGIIRWSTPRNSSAIMSPRFWRRYFQNVLHVTPSWRSLDNMRWLVDRMVKKAISTRLMLVKNVEVSMAVDMTGDYIIFGIIRAPPQTQAAPPTQALPTQAPPPTPSVL